MAVSPMADGDCRAMGEKEWIEKLRLELVVLRDITAVTFFQDY